MIVWSCFIFILKLTCFRTFSSEKIVVFEKWMREEGAKSNVVTHAWDLQKKVKAKGKLLCLWVMFKLISAWLYVQQTEREITYD